jgi:hypothetical protein
VTEQYSKRQKVEDRRLRAEGLLLVRGRSRG